MPDQKAEPALVGVTFNCWVGQKPEDLRANLGNLIRATGRPHVLALQEARRWDGTLPGYVRYAHPADEHDEDANCVLLVRDDLKVHRHGFIAVDGGDWTYEGHPHPPRIFPWLAVEAAGRRWDVVDVHRIPGGPHSRNHKAWAAEHLELVDWFTARHARHPRRPLIALGDHNDHAQDRHRYSVSRLARDVGGKASLFSIDGAIAVNARARGRRLDRNFGSDHPGPVRFTFHPKETR